MRPLILLLTLAAAPGAALAQTPTTSPAEADLLPTLEITADIHMDSVKFSQTGDSRVEIGAEPGGKGAWKLDSPLPRPIPVGKTFRNVDLKLRAAATVNDQGQVTATGAAEATSGDPPPN